VEAGQRIGGRRTRNSKSNFPSDGDGHIDTKAVRKWAESNGVELSSRGRVPADVIKKYKAAGN
jgi:hypothetical protein